MNLMMWARLAYINGFTRHNKALESLAKKNQAVYTLMNVVTIFNVHRFCTNNVEHINLLYKKTIDNMLLKE